jgi:methylaspartate ammonia-lyase
MSLNGTQRLHRRETRPLRIENVLFAPGLGAFFYDDQAAIRAGAVSDGFRYMGSALTPGFSAVRMPARSLGIGLVLTDGGVVWGDMMSVQYAGAAGRDAPFEPVAATALIRKQLLPRLEGLDVSSFRDASMRVFEEDVHGGHSPAPLAIRYGLSQALLQAAAHSSRRTMAEVICDEYALPLSARAVPILAQSGDARESNTDKMILKSVDILPHGLINSGPKFGPNGETFRAFVEWVSARIRAIGAQDYRPTLHFEVYGQMGLQFRLSISRIAAFIAELADIVAPFQLNIECPADFGSRDAQIEGYVALVAALDQSGSTARIVVDERCNTLADIRDFARAGAGHVAQIKMPDVGALGDAVLAVIACKQHGMGAYVGGSCVETDISAKASVHVAVATQADMMLAKPGMGVDEALSIVGNEQSRLLQMLELRGQG